MKKVSLTVYIPTAHREEVLNDWDKRLLSLLTYQKGYKISRAFAKKRVAEGVGDYECGHVKITLDRPDTTDSPSRVERSCDPRLLLTQSTASPTESNQTIDHPPLSNTDRATTIPVVLEDYLTHSGYEHGGINE